jgi:hypothetical protein
MLIDLIANALIAAYIAVVALGHGCLVAAIYQCLRADHFGGRRQESAAAGPSAVAAPLHAPLS